MIEEYNKKGVIMSFLFIAKYIGKCILIIFGALIFDILLASGMTHFSSLVYDIGKSGILFTLFLDIIVTRSLTIALFVGVLGGLWLGKRSLIVSGFILSFLFELLFSSS